MDKDHDRFRVVAEELKGYSAEIAKMREISAAAARAKSGGEDVTNKRTKKSATSTTKFIMFPMEWHFRLIRVNADKCTYRVALYLLHESWRSQSTYLKLANDALKSLGVGREGKRHALEQLEEAGLVLVERKDRKSPMVKLMFINRK